MKAEFVNPFITAAADVLNAETKGRTSRKGNLRLDHGSETSQEVTAMVGLTGGVRGVVMLAMPEAVARKIYGAMVGEDDPDMDEMAHSALGELCNMITGQAATALADAGHHTNLTPPTIITGKGAQLSTLTMPRLVIPLSTRHGELQIDIAISEGDDAAA